MASGIAPSIIPGAGPQIGSGGRKSPDSCTNPDDSIPAPGGLKRRYLPLGTFLSAWTRIDDDHPCLAMDRDRFELAQACR